MHSAVHEAVIDVAAVADPRRMTRSQTQDGDHDDVEHFDA
jgi:hypothetical protein